VIYDAVGNLLSVTDPENHTTGYTYDRLSRNTQITQPLGQSVQHVYWIRGQTTFLVSPLLSTGVAG